MQTGFGYSDAAQTHINGLTALLELNINHLGIQDMKIFAVQPNHEPACHELTWTFKLSRGISLLNSEMGLQCLGAVSPGPAASQSTASKPNGFGTITSGTLNNTITHILADHALRLSLFEKADDNTLTPEDTKRLMEYNCPQEMQKIASQISVVSSQLEACIGLTLMVVMLTVFHSQCFGSLWLQLRKDLVTAIGTASSTSSAREHACLPLVQVHCAY